MLGGAHGSWKMKGRERERERLRELERARLETSFFLFVVAQVPDFVVQVHFSLTCVFY